MRGGEKRALSRLSKCAHVWTRKAISVFLCASLALAVPPIALAQAREALAGASKQPADSGISVSNFPSTETVVETASQASAVYEDGDILLSSFEQLLLVGSGQPVTTLDADASLIGSGDLVRASDGSAVVYAADASYRLVADIAIPQGETWMLPQGFVGTFRASGEVEDSGRTLYDAATDTIYVHNPYQLALIAQEDAADQVVLSNDADASKFGTGTPLATDQGILTYSSEHSYVVSRDFSEKTPRSPSVMPEADLAEDMSAKSVEANDGRDFAGQVVKTIAGEDYILVGSASQLAAIGADAPVYTAAYELEWVKRSSRIGRPL